jgi:hypothetical protein
MALSICKGTIIISIRSENITNSSCVVCGERVEEGVGLVF